jgi:hypothetical protein
MVQIRKLLHFQIQNPDPKPQVMDPDLAKSLRSPQIRINYTGGTGFDKLMFMKDNCQHLGLLEQDKEAAMVEAEHDSLRSSKHFYI